MALDFTGSSIAYRNGVNIGNVQTIMAWVKFDALAGGSWHNCWHHSSLNSLGSYGATVEYWSTDTGYTGGTLTTATWFHIAVVRNNTAYAVYLDGTSVASGTATLAGVNAALVLGAWGGSADFLDGAMAHVRVYNGTAMTQAQVQAEMASATPVVTTNLYAAWSLDSVLTDSSGNGLTLTHSGTPAYVSGPTFGGGGGSEYENSLTLAQAAGVGQGSVQGARGSLTLAQNATTQPTGQIAAFATVTLQAGAVLAQGALAALLAALPVGAVGALVSASDVATGAQMYLVSLALPAAGAVGQGAAALLPGGVGLATSAAWAAGAAAALPSNLALGAGAGLTAKSGAAWQGHVNISATAVWLAATQGALRASLPLPSLATAQAGSNQAAQVSVTLPVAGVVGLGAVALWAGHLTLHGAAAQTAAARLAAAGNVALDAGAGLSLAALYAGDVGVHLAVTATEGQTGAPLYEMTLGLDATAQLADDGRVVFVGHALLGAGAGIAAGANWRTGATLPLASVAGILAAAQLAGQSNVTLAAVAATVEDATAQLLSALALAVEAGAVLAGGAMSVTVTTPDGRTLTVALDLRTLEVAIEPRTLVVDFERRIIQA